MEGIHRPDRQVVRAARTRRPPEPRVTAPGRTPQDAHRGRAQPHGSSDAPHETRTRRRSYRSRTFVDRSRRRGCAARVRRRLQALRRGETVVSHGRALRVTRLTSGTAPRVANPCNETEVRQQYGALTRCERSDVSALRRSRYSSACSFAQRSVRRAHCHAHRGNALRTFASASEPCRVSSDPAHSRLTVTPRVPHGRGMQRPTGSRTRSTRGASRLPARRARAVFHWVSRTTETRGD